MPSDLQELLCLAELCGVVHPGALLRVEFLANLLELWRGRVLRRGEGLSNCPGIPGPAQGPGTAAAGEDWDRLERDVGDLRQTRPC